jgi:hypothetical protein
MQREWAKSDGTMTSVYKYVTPIDKIGHWMHN